MTISRGEEGEGAEEGPRITVPSQLVTEYEEFPPSIVVDTESTLRDKLSKGGNQPFPPAGKEKELEREIVTEESNSQPQVNSIQKEELRSELVSKETEQCQVIDEPCTTAPVGYENDSTLPSEEAMGISLLNELSFFPDPLAMSRTCTAPDDHDSLAISGASQTSIGDHSRHDKTTEKEDALLPTVEPSSSPFESVLYSNQDPPHNDIND